MGFNLIYWTPISGLYLFVVSNLEIKRNNMNCCWPVIFSQSYTEEAIKMLYNLRRCDSTLQRVCKLLTCIFPYEVELLNKWVESIAWSLRVVFLLNILVQGTYTLSQPPILCIFALPAGLTPLLPFLCMLSRGSLREI